MFGAGAATIVLDDVTSVGNAQKRIVCFMVSPRCEITLVRRDDRKMPAVGEFKKLVFDVNFFGETVPLQLDIKPIAEDLLERL